MVVQGKYNEITTRQTENGVVCLVRRQGYSGVKEFVFTDKKDLLDFIGDNFIDAEEMAQLEDEKRKEHKEK